jgi:hypothetical protein
MTTSDRPVCRCARKLHPRCCSARATATLRERDAALVGLASRHGLGLERLASLAVRARYVTRDPLAVPDGWTLLPGRHVLWPGTGLAPVVTERVVPGTGLLRLPLTTVPDPDGRIVVRASSVELSELPAQVVLGGILAAADKVLSGSGDEGDQVLRLASFGHGRVELEQCERVVAEVAHQAEIRQVWLDGRELTELRRARGPVCPTASGNGVDPVSVAVVVTTAEGTLLGHGGLPTPISGALTPTDADDAVSLVDACTIAAARLVGTHLAAGTPLELRLLGITRDLARGGAPVAHVEAHVRASADELGVHTVSLASPAPTGLLSLAASTAPVERTTRTALHLLARSSRAA